MVDTDIDDYSAWFNPTAFYQYFVDRQATITISARLQIFGKSTVLLWQMVTVALFRQGS
jgi:hypothetical protein